MKYFIFSILSIIVLSCGDDDEVSESSCDSIESELSSTLKGYLGVETRDELIVCETDADCSSFSIPNLEKPVNGVCPAAYNKNFQSLVEIYNNDKKVSSLIEEYDCSIVSPGCLPISAISCVDRKCEATY